MEIKITKKLNTPEIQEIKEFEQANNLKIPKEFQAFLIKYNPIYLENNVYKFGNETFYIDRFYPFDKTYELSIQTIFLNLRDYLGNDYLAFANDPGNWQYVISLNNNSYGEIYLCRMDDIIPDSLQKIANNFREFINGLKIEK